MSLGRAKECDRNCGTLIAWDKEEGYFVEPENNNEPHRRDRCESLGGVWKSFGGGQQQAAVTSAPTTRTNTEVKKAVNQDINFAILQKLGDIENLLKKIAGVAE